MCNVTRTPIKVPRTPITAFTEAGRSIGGWYAFPPPEGERPPYMAKKKSSLMLWCPYCGDWSVFSNKDGRQVCTGHCKWAHTYDFYVSKYNVGRL